MAVMTMTAVSHAQETVQAKQADKFVDSIGVNVHMEYLGTPYGNYQMINEKLVALGDAPRPRRNQRR